MVELLRRQADVSYNALLESIKDLDERGSWMRLTSREGDYLHTDGSIIGQITHVAGCKVLYASAAFKGFEIRLREITDRTIEIAADWAAAKAYLSESHEYWTKSWAGIGASDLEAEADTNWGDRWPIWKIIHVVLGHDDYHAGQIALIRAVAPAAESAPPPLTEEEIDFLKTFKAW